MLSDRLWCPDSAFWLGLDGFCCSVVTDAAAAEGGSGPIDTEGDFLWVPSSSFCVSCNSGSFLSGCCLFSGVSWCASAVGANVPLDSKSVARGSAQTWGFFTLTAGGRNERNGGNIHNNTYKHTNNSKIAQTDKIRPCKSKCMYSGICNQLSL